MRKFNILMLGAISLMAASCDDAPEIAKPQENAPAAPITQADVTISPAAALASGSVDLEALKGSQAVEIFRIDQMSDTVSVSDLTFEMLLSKNENLGDAQVIDVKVSTESGSAVGTVDADAWNAAHNALFGRSLKEKTAYWGVPVFYTCDGTEYRLGGSDYYAAKGTVKETCYDSGFRVDNAYYLLGNATTWDLAAASADEYKFSHSDLDPMDDPVFTYTFNVTQDLLDANGGGCYWKIASATAIAENEWKKVLGTENDGDTRLSGMLYEGGQAGKLTEVGRYTLKINIEESTYEFTYGPLHPDYLWTPGNGTSWFQGVPCQVLAWSDKKNYVAGFAILDGIFKFTTEEGWGGINYGDGGALPENSDDVKVPFTTYAGTLSTDGGAGNLNVGAKGLYWCVANVNDMQWCAEPVTSVGVIGELNGWGGQAPLAAVDETLLVWSGDIDFSKAGGWKFRVNDNWDANLGGALDNLVLDGGNLDMAETGVYTVTLDLSKLPYTATVTKK